MGSFLLTEVGRFLTWRFLFIHLCHVISPIFVQKKEEKEMNVKNELAKKAGNTGQVKLTKNMAIADMIKALEPEIARALPNVMGFSWMPGVLKNPRLSLKI